MGCVCCSLSSFISIVLDALERISLCTVCAMLTCCLLFTIISVMIMGVGIGYHYCFVSNSVESMAKAAKAAGAVRRGGGGPLQVTPGHIMRSLDKAVKSGFSHRLARRETNGTVYSNRNTNYTNTSHNVSETTVMNVERFNATNITSI